MDLLISVLFGQYELHVDVFNVNCVAGRQALLELGKSSKRGGNNGRFVVCNLNVHKMFSGWPVYGETGHASL